MYNRLGILITEENYRKGNLTDLRTIDVNDCFQHLSEAEIAISHGYMISDF